nr:GNAT family N-acetyltransferase [Lysobacter sp. GX 14042]
MIGLERYPDLGVDWTALEAQARGAPFTSWAWVSAWLRNLPDGVAPLVFRARDSGGLLALALLVAAPEHGVGRLFGRRSLYLQETADPVLDEVTIEYAGLLAREGCARPAYAALFQVLAGLRRDWRRLCISTSADAGAVAAALPPALRAASTLARPCHYVDLARVRAEPGGYKAVLGRKVRGSMRQTVRDYARFGPLQAEVAADVPTALAWFDALQDLHTRYWHSRGQPGCFASPFFGRFHRDLIAHGTGAGFTRLTRVCAGDEVVGYLYNLGWRDNIYFYNSGLRYGLLEKRDRPGIATLYAAIGQAAAEGRAEFDFLAGDQEYKRRLATDARTLHSIEVRRGGMRPMAERLLAALARRGTPGLPLARALAMDAAAGPPP